jgi:hypothetical protein
LFDNFVNYFLYIIFQIILGGMSYNEMYKQAVADFLGINASDIEVLQESPLMRMATIRGLLPASGGAGFPINPNLTVHFGAPSRVRKLVRLSSSAPQTAGRNGW